MPKDTTTRETKGPAMWRYAKAIHHDMDRGAEEMLVDKIRVRVYKGAMTGLMSKHRVSSPYYGPLTKFLRDVGSIQMIRRGNGMAESLWEVGPKPTKAAFDAWNKKEETRNYAARNRSKQYAQLEQQVIDLKKRIGVIDIKRGFSTLGKDIAKLNNRLTEFEARLGEVEKDLGVANEE